MRSLLWALQESLPFLVPSLVHSPDEFPGVMLTFQLGRGGDSQDLSGHGLSLILEFSEGRTVQAVSW